MSAFTRFVTGRRTAWLVALVPLILAVLVIGGVAEGERDIKPTDSRPAGADSTKAIELAESLPKSDGMVAIVLWSSEDGEPLGEDRVAELTQQTVGLLSEATAGATGEGQGQPGAEGGMPGAEGGPPGEGAESPLTVAEDDSAAYAVLPVASKSNTENIDKVTELREQLRDEAPEGVDVQVTGPAGIQADIGQVFDGANLRLLLSTAGVVAFLLILTYRSPVLWLIPLTVVGIADRFAAIVATNVLERLQGPLSLSWDESTVGIQSVLVFGAGTNYALLLISRYRDELKGTESRHEAMAVALRRTIEPVTASATTVFLGLLTLVLSAIPATRGLGVANAIGIVIAATFVLVVLPAVLVLFGRWVFWPRRPQVGDARMVDSGGIFNRVGRGVSARPRTFVVATLVGLALLATGNLFIDTGLRPADQFLEKPEAIAASERLAESFPAGISDPVQVVTRADAAEVTDTVSRVEGVQSARVTNEGDGVTRIDAVLADAPGSPAAFAAIEDIRASVDDYTDTYVGGGDAEALDDRTWAQRDRVVILPVILLLVVLALVVLLRSVATPLLLVATVVASYAASMGAAWWLFTGVFGFAAMDVGVPLLAFLFLVALGVDYNIFLVTRAREEAVEHGTREGMLRALTATGGVITSAGVLLAAVFAVLGVLPLVVLAQLGAVICVGVLIDTLVVRTVLVPALALTLGDRFWWPRRVGPAQ